MTMEDIEDLTNNKYSQEVMDQVYMRLGDICQARIFNIQERVDEAEKELIRLCEEDPLLLPTMNYVTSCLKKSKEPSALSLKCYCLIGSTIVEDYEESERLKKEIEDSITSS